MSVEEISRRLAAFPANGGIGMPTVSYGITTYGNGTSDVDGLISAADEAMYTAKALGRNRAAHSDRTP
jgi:PleD family two-component response regulator